MLFLGVCATWAEIALSTPALWATIHVDFPRAEGFDQLFDSYLIRSRSRMLSVTFSDELDESISRALCQHADRVHKLELLEFPTRRDDLLPLASFSGLKALTLAVQYSDETGSIPVASLLGMLRDAPRIVECILGNLYMDDDDDPYQKEPLILPSLQYLALGSGSSDYCSAFMLEYLSLPALRTLVIRTSILISRTLFHFLHDQKHRCGLCPLTHTITPGALTWLLSYLVSCLP
jgi:hypothetical protein